MGPFTFSHSDLRVGINAGIKDGYSSELLLAYSCAKVIKSIADRITTAAYPFCTYFLDIYYSS